MAKRSPQTAAKREREQAKREKRERKLEKKAAAAANRDAPVDEAPPAESLEDDGGAATPQ